MGVLVLIGASFIAGMKFDQHRAVLSGRGGLAGQFGDRQGRLMGGGGQRSMRGAASGGFVAGEVLSKDDKSITVKLPDGGSKIVFLSESTSILKSASGTSSDLIVGEQVLVTGKANQDGSVSAESVQLRSGMPMMRTTESGGR